VHQELGHLPSGSVHFDACLRSNNRFLRCRRTSACEVGGPELGIIEAADESDAGVSVAADVAGATAAVVAGAFVTGAFAAAVVAAAEALAVVCSIVKFPVLSSSRILGASVLVSIYSCFVLQAL